MKTSAQNIPVIPQTYTHLFRAAPRAYGASKTRVGIRDVATILQHSNSNVGPEQHQILNPLSEARV